MSGLTTKQVADRFGVTTQAVQGWIRKGLITPRLRASPGRRPGSLFDAGLVEAFLPPKRTPSAIRCGQNYRQNLEVRRAYAKAYRTANLEECRARDRAYQQRSKESANARTYGLSLEAYRSMFEAQNHVCAVCRNPEKRGRRLSVDHCHATGRVRGLLCSRCNLILGLAHDDAGRLAAATAYLGGT